MRPTAARRLVSNRDLRRRGVPRLPLPPRDARHGRIEVQPDVKQGADANIYPDGVLVLYAVLQVASLAWESEYVM